MKTLIVDDNYTNRRLLEEITSHWGMQASSAQSGREALLVLQQAKAIFRPYQLVLLDSQMPEMDGFSVAEKIMATPELAGATIMMLTSAGKQGDLARCQELGIAAYLKKPIRQSQLLDAVMTALGSKSMEEPAAPITEHNSCTSRRRLNILLAEDNAVNQKIAVHLLSRWGHSVTVVENGKQAVAAYNDGAFDVILMDIQMPEMDGFEATRAIRNRERETRTRIPIVAITAHAMEGDRQRCILAGMDMHVTKPLRPSELLEVLHRISIADGPPSGHGSELHAPQSKDADADDCIFNAKDFLRRLDGNEKLYRETLDLFREQCPRMMNAIRSAVSHKNAHEVHLTAHALKGAAANVSANSVSRRAAQLEEAGRDRDFAVLDRHLESLENEIERLQSHLSEALKGVQA